MKRITRHNSIISKIVSVDVAKNARGFIEDISVGDTTQPCLIRLTDADCWNLYKGNDWILSVVNRIVRDCVKVKPRIVPKQKDKDISGRLKKRIEVVEKFLDNPNNNKESFADIREKTIRDLLVYGRKAIEKVLNPFTRTLKEIYAQCPKNLTINTDAHGNIRPTRSYKLLPYGAKDPVYWDIDEMIYIVHNPISNSAYGMRILDGIANTVASDMLRATHNANYFINGAEAAGLLGLEGMSDKALKAFRSYWKENFKGAHNAHKTAAVNVPIKYVRMAITNRDLEFSEYGKELRAKIFSGYGMQPVVMGIGDASSGKTSTAEQIELYKDGALRPILSKEAYYYTKEIIEIGFGFDDVMVEFIGIDQIDIGTQSTIDIAETTAGLQTINEVRLRRGDPKVPWGDTPISVLPGGGQVDPNSGKLIPPSKTGDSTNGKTNANTKKPKAKKGSKHLKHCKLMTELYIVNETTEKAYENMDIVLSANEEDDFEKLLTCKVREIICRHIAAGSQSEIIKEIDELLKGLK